jgi:hypothetical protein
MALSGVGNQHEFFTTGAEVLLEAWFVQTILAKSGVGTIMACR